MMHGQKNIKLPREESTLKTCYRPDKIFSLALKLGC